MSEQPLAHDSVPPDTSDDARRLQKRLAFLQLTADDMTRMQSMLPLFRNCASEFVETFYRHLFNFPQTAQLLTDDALVDQLKRMQAEHFCSMLMANWDAEYVARRHRVGHVHAEVGIEPDMFLGAYNQFVQFCFARFVSDGSQLSRDDLENLLSVLKGIFLDVGLTLDAYFAQLTQRLRQALDLYWKVNTELRQFNKLASHDLKTPLATVANLCEEALDEFGDQMPAAARELVASARQRTFQMSELIDELLASSEFAESTVGQEITSSQNAFDAARERLLLLATQRNTTISVPRNLPPVVASQPRLREAVYNLLSNAVKFCDKATGRVTVSIQRHSDQKQVIFCIADNGTGIPTEELGRIFSPFRRLPMHHGVPGSGLGLYFAKTIIENQNGRIWAESKLGEGSRFYVQLQLADADPLADAAAL